MAGEQKYLVADELQARRVAALVSGLKIDGKPWQITVCRYVKKRTLPQNNLLWKWYEIIGNETGNDKQDLHDFFRERFLPWEEIDVLGKKKKVLTNTSDPKFTTDKMSAYMTNIERFAATELGMMLPHPEDDHYSELAAR